MEMETIQAWEPTKPYNYLPKLPPATLLESRVVLKQCVASRAALAELKMAAELIPNPAVLINTLPLLEAQASSEIENIVTTADSLFRHAAADDERADPATREALRYRYALLHGFQTLPSLPICTRTAEAICTHIKGMEMAVRKVPGTQLINTATHDVIYTPPDGEDLVRALLHNWERFLHDQVTESELDPLVRMAVAHYQFEAIHPFTDGNGRTGRVLNSLFLVEQGLLSLPILYLSRYIIQHKADYYRLLLAVTRDGAWEEWILYILRGIEETARWTVTKISAVRKLAALVMEHLRTNHPKLARREIVDAIFEQPYCRIQTLVARDLGTRQAASKYLHGLVAADVLIEVPVGREKLFLHPRLMALLTRDSNEISPFRIDSPRRAVVQS
jgi:Fic family protein